MKGDPGYTASLTKVNDRSIITTVKREGKVLMMYHQTISTDGKTLHHRGGEQGARNHNHVYCNQAI